MSEVARKSVSQKMLKSVYCPEGIFLQPIDQQYERNAKMGDVNETAEMFFEEYEQGQHMKHMLADLDVSTDSDSECAVTRENSVKKSKNEDRAQIKVGDCLIINWETSVENFKKQQKSFLQYLSLSNHNSPYLNRTRAYSNCLPVSKFSFPKISPFHSEDFTNNLNQLNLGNSHANPTNPFKISSGVNFFNN